MIFSASTAILHRRTQALDTARDAARFGSHLRSRRAGSREFFLSAEPQIVVAWGSEFGEPDIEGDLSLVMDVPVPRRVLGFGSWLAPDSPKDRAMRGALAQPARVFVCRSSVSPDVISEAEGRAIGRARRHACARRIRGQAGTDAIAGAARTFADGHRSAAHHAGCDSRSLWMRDADNRVAWVNAAYARAVEASDGRDAATAA